MVSGPGKPRELVSHLGIRSDTCTDEGPDIVLDIFDKDHVRDSYVKADEVQGRCERCRQMRGRTMEDYLREARVAKRLLERGGIGTTISGVSIARKLLRRSGLAALEQRGVLAAAGALGDQRMSSFHLLRKTAATEDANSTKQSISTCISAAECGL